MYQRLHHMSLASSLMEAVKEGDICLVEKLCQMGASVNGTDECGYAPLHWTAIYDKLEIAHVLVRDGRADLNVRDQDGYTPLHLSIKYGHRNVLRLLLNYGADVRERTRGGRIAEELAMAYDRWDVVETLSQHRKNSVCYTENEPRRWKTQRLLGTGGFGRVYLGHDLDTGRAFAIKEVETPNQRKSVIQRQVQELDTEIRVLRNLQHKNIVKYLGMERKRPATMFIFMEYMPGGSVYDLLLKRGPLSEQRVASYSRQILEGVAYLHENMVIHRDIKSANILLDATQTHAKLGDFGLSKRLERCSMMTSGLQAVLGSPYWMAPEVVTAAPMEGRGYGRRADIWSIGCTIIEMKTTKPPWSDMEPMTAIYNIGAGARSPEFPPEISNALRDVLCQCLKRDPKSRPTAAKLLNHPFLARKRYSCQEESSLTRFKQGRTAQDSSINQGYWCLIRSAFNSFFQILVGGFFALYNRWKRNT